MTSKDNEELGPSFQLSAGGVCELKEILPCPALPCL